MHAGHTARRRQNQNRNPISLIPDLKNSNNLLWKVMCPVTDIQAQADSTKEGFRKNFMEKSVFPGYWRRSGVLTDRDGQRGIQG